MMPQPPLCARHRRFVLLPALCAAGLLLGGCAASPPLGAATTAPVNDAVTTIPHPAPPPANNDARLSELQAQIDHIRQQIDELQRRQTAFGQLLSLHSPARADGTDTNAATGSNRWQLAQQQYRAGLYAQTVRTLAGADSGGDGGTEAQNSMYLLIQSHARLNNCESAINIGNRFASRFARNPQAAEALWQVGLCQWQMQQQDIARDTWRKITRTYPTSAAAKRAWQRLNQGQ